MEKRTYAVSDQTKQAMVSALKAMMIQKPVDKITIQDITDRCGIRRQNFYYHFADIPTLLEQIITDEAEKIIAEHPAV